MTPKKNKTEKKLSNTGASGDADLERLRQNTYLSAMEKLSLFTEMLRRNQLYKKAVIAHK